MQLLNIGPVSLPIEDPILKFLLELIIILAAPLLLNKIKVPHLLGLIIAGAIIGPNGLNVLSRDSSVVVTGTTGLLYIMFLAGLEIDMGDFKKNKWKSLGFAGYTFAIPFLLGLAGGYYLLHFPPLTAILFSSLFSSHTLIAYPMVSRLGVAKKASVNITVGGTMLTDILSLLVLAVVVGMTQGAVGSAFWTKLTISVIAFGVIVLVVFPIISRWFFKNVEDKISQYIFVLVMIYLAALLAEVAGIEAIIGAFFAGLALNRLIPQKSSLMNRVEFIGNAIFIPFFLISVGMLIDFSVFFKSWETIGVAGIMLIASIGGKYLAAMATQKTFRFTRDEGMLIFGMSTASAAATLATVMVGYNIIVAENGAGEPVRLLSEHVLNGSILLILVSCTVSSFISMSSAQRISETQNEEKLSGSGDQQENILLAINYEDTVEEMVDLGVMIKTDGSENHLLALNVINEDKNDSSIKNAEKVLGQAADLAAAADVSLQEVTRYDNDVIEGINNVIKEQKITDLVIALREGRGFSSSFIYNINNGYLQNESINLLVYHAAQPIATLERYAVLIPANAEKEAGFFPALLRIWNIGRKSGTFMRFYVNEPVAAILKRISRKVSIEAEFNIVPNWEAARKAGLSIAENEGLIVVMAKRGTAAYFPGMNEIPRLLTRDLANNNYLLIYPSSAKEVNDSERRSLSNQGDFMEIGKIISRLFS